LIKHAYATAACLQPPISKVALQVESTIFHFAIALQKEAFPTLIMGNEKFQLENEPVATAPGSVTQAAPATQSFAI
jgi:hypothetical protein